MVTRFWSLTLHVTSFNPAEPGRNVTLAVPWPPVIAASPETVQRNVRSPLRAGGTEAVTVVALALTVAGPVMAPAASAPKTVTWVEGV